MNYRRGLQRLYAVVAIAWIAFALIDGPWNGTLFNPLHMTPAQTIIRFVIEVLLPPAFGYFLIFVVGTWVYRGFRS